MKIYCINYQSGEYDSYSDDFVGGWSTEEKRKIALDKLKVVKYNEYEYARDNYDKLVCWEFEVDKTLEKQIWVYSS